PMSAQIAENIHLYSEDTEPSDRLLPPPTPSDRRLLHPSNPSWSCKERSSRNSPGLPDPYTGLHTLHTAPSSASEQAPSDPAPGVLPHRPPTKSDILLPAVTLPASLR